MRRCWLPALVTAVLVAGLTTTTAGAAEESADESPVSGVVLAAALDDGSERVSYALRLADGSVVPVDAGLDGVDPGSRFSGTLARTAGRTTARPAALRPPVTDAVTTHRVVTAVVDGLGTFELGDDDLAAVTHDVAAFWEDESDGAADLQVVPGPVHVSGVGATPGDCGLASASQFWSIVEQASARFPDYTFLGGSDQLLLYVPETGCFAGAAIGRAVIGLDFSSGGVAIVAAGDDPLGARSTTGHELGHTFGLGHADVASPPFTVMTEYAGLYDVMGLTFSDTHQLVALSTPYRVAQGIVEAGEVVDLPTGGNATLAPREAESGVRSARVVDPDTGKPLYVDLRSGTGRDAGSVYTVGYDIWGYALEPGVVVSRLDTDKRITVLANDDPLESDPTSFAPGETWRNASGSLRLQVSGALTSATVKAVAGPTTPWVSTGTATLSWPVGGPLEVGTRLEVGDTGWNPQPAARHVRWYADGVLLAGESSRALTVTRDLAGADLQAKVTAYAWGRPPTTIATKTVTVPVPAIDPAPRPTIKGKARVGRTLRARAAGWPEGTTFSYVWRSGGTRIKKATTRTLVLKKRHRGTRITVTVTGRLDGFLPVKRTSARTRTVR